MTSGQPASRSFFVLASLFILGYFALFTYSSLNSYLTFDDGMNLISMHHLGQLPFWRNMLQILKVFTTENRPLGALFYRPMYAMFGFNPFAFRVVVYVLLIGNIIIAHRFARVFGATKGAAALSTLLFCYNASLADLFYNTGTVYDVICFPLFFFALITYARERNKGGLSTRTMIVVMLLLLLALDAKENAVMLSADLVFFELLYRRQDWTSRAVMQRVGGFLALVAAVCAIFLKVKVAEMSNNQFYQPHLSAPFVLHGMGHYFEQYFYLKPETLGPASTAIVIAILLGAATALRSRPAVFGLLMFVAGILPVAVIPPREGYAAYLAFPGLTLALGSILDSLRTLLLRVTRQEKFERVTMAVLFVAVAAVSIFRFAHDRKIRMTNIVWSEQRISGIVEAFKRQIPEFPPDGRILILDDPWGPDWGPMFLVRLKFNDFHVWIDRMKNPEKTGDRDSYDLLVTYKEPRISFYPDKILGIKLNWEVRARSFVGGYLILSAPTESRTPRNLDFAPATARTGMPIKMTVPGIAGTKIDAVYRVLSGGKSSANVAKDWCTLDDQGSCTVTAPAVDRMGALAVDWIRRPGERWIFTNGVVPVVE